MGGTEDKITPLKIQLKLAQKYADRATLEVITGACHWTIGGSHFPKIKQIMFSWLNQQTDMSSTKNNNANVASQAA